MLGAGDVALGEHFHHDNVHAHMKNYVGVAMCAMTAKPTPPPPTR